MKIAHYDKPTGKLLGWYDPSIHCKLIESPKFDENGKMIEPAKYDTSTLPTPFIEVDEATWQEAIDNNYNFVDAKTGKLSHKDFRTLDELKQAKTNQLRADYETANQADVEYMGTTFQADRGSQDLIAQVLSVGMVPDGFFWRDKFNNDVPMTYEELQGLGATILTRNQQNFVKFQKLKDMVKSVKDKTELDNIVWS